MARDVYQTAAWRSVRKQVLERDKRKCQLRLPKCQGTATAVDHRVELWEGGDPYDLENLAATCVNCNSRKHMAVLNRRAKVRVRAW